MAWYGNLKLKILHNIAAVVYKMLKHPRLSFEARLIEYHPLSSNTVDVRTSVTQRMLDIGCGDRKIEGSFGLDVVKKPGVDIVADARHLPFKDQSIDHVHASHVVNILVMKKSER